MNFAYKVSKKHSWDFEIQKNVNLFRDSYFYKKYKLQALRDTGIRIPEDLNKTYTSGDSRIRIQRGCKGNGENEINEYTLKDSRIRVPIGTKNETKMYNRSNYSKPTQYSNPIYYDKHNKNHLFNSQTHHLNSYHDSYYDYSCKEGQYYPDHPQYSQKN